MFRDCSDGIRYDEYSKAEAVSKQGEVASGSEGSVSLKEQAGNGAERMRRGFR